MKPKEHLDSLIDKLKDVEPIEPSPFMFAKIKYKIELKNATQQPRKSWLVKTAVYVSFILLLVINFYVIYSFSQQNEDADNSSSELYSYSTTNDSYYSY